MILDFRGREYRCNYYAGNYFIKIRLVLVTGVIKEDLMIIIMLLLYGLEVNKFSLITVHLIREH